MKRRQPEDSMPAPPPVPDLGPMPVCRAEQRNRAGLDYPDVFPSSCGQCVRLALYNEEVDDYRRDVSEWIERTGCTPLDELRFRVMLNSPVCHVDFP